jgi:hypothetical protein
LIDPQQVAVEAPENPVQEESPKEEMQDAVLDSEEAPGKKEEAKK